MLELLPDARRRSSQPSPDFSAPSATVTAVSASTFLTPASALRANGAALPVPEVPPYPPLSLPTRLPVDLSRSSFDTARPFLDRARSPLGLSKPVHLGKPVDIPRPPIDIPKSPLGNPKPPGCAPRRLETFKPFPDPPKPSEFAVPIQSIVTPLPDVCTTPAKPLLDTSKSNQDFSDTSPDIAKTPKETPKQPIQKAPGTSARLLVELSRPPAPPPPPRSPSVPLSLPKQETEPPEEIIWQEKISLPIPKTVRPTSPVKDVPSSKHSSPSRNLVHVVDVKPKPLRKEIFVGGGSCKELSRPLSAERSSFRGSRESYKFSTLPKPTRHLSRSSTPQPGVRPKSVAFALDEGEGGHSTSLSILCAASSGDGTGFDTIVKIPATLLLSGKSLVIGSEEEYYERHQVCCGGLPPPPPPPGGLIMGASGGAGAGARAAAADAAESCGGGACRKLLAGRGRHAPSPAQQQAPPPPPPRDPMHYSLQPQTAAGGIPGGGGAGGTGPGPGGYIPLGATACGSQSNRSQPAIGLKQTPKARPTIFGTVASDQNPKDGSSRRSLPQTPQSAKGFSALLNGGAAGEHGSSAESVPEAATDADHALVYRDGGNLVSGSLEALVRHMVPTAEYYPDRAYLFAFLLSSRLFIKPHELLGEVCAVCEAQQKLGERSPAAKERLGRFIPHLVQLLAEWTETFPYDFRDERVMAHVRSITQKCVTAEPGIRKEVSTLLQNLLHRLTTLEKYEEFLQRVNAESSTNTVENLSPVEVTELCPSPTLLAQQLTHIELERLSYIGPEEFVQAFAKDNPHLETSFKDMKKTRNLESYVQWFNRLSYFVATEVCKHVKKKQRVKVMEFWIEVARECFNIGNFNSLMAIIAGLNMSPISRLKKTWNKVQQAKFSILEHQMDPSSNFSSYRSTLKAAMWRSAGATDERQRIVIPFFSLLVKDIYFLNEGCSNKLPNGHINFEKFWQLAKQVTEFITWKQVTCPFEKNTKVITFLQASPVLTENALALASFECEPPENNHEKERYKSLKSELNS